MLHSPLPHTVTAPLSHCALNGATDTQTFRAATDSAAACSTLLDSGAPAPAPIVEEPLPDGSMGNVTVSAMTPDADPENSNIASAGGTAPPPESGTAAALGAAGALAAAGASACAAMLLGA